MVLLAESVMRRLPKPGAQQAKHRARFALGIWLGCSESSNEHVVGAGNGWLTARTARRLPGRRRRPSGRCARPST
eukprot:1508318-Alexandrium_andersonii.AAC.1